MQQDKCCRKQLVSFVFGSAVMWVIWLLTTTDFRGIPWPVYPMVFWALAIFGGWLRKKYCPCSKEKLEDSSSCDQSSCGCSDKDKAGK